MYLSANVEIYVFTGNKQLMIPKLNANKNNYVNLDYTLIKNIYLYSIHKRNKSKDLIRHTFKL